MQPGAMQSGEPGSPQDHTRLMNFLLGGTATAGFFVYSLAQHRQPSTQKLREEREEAAVQPVTSTKEPGAAPLDDEAGGAGNAGSTEGGNPGSDDGGGRGSSYMVAVKHAIADTVDMLEDIVDAVEDFVDTFEDMDSAD